MTDAPTRAPRGVALVTGGGRGIGAAIAGALAVAGFDIAILSSESADTAAAAIDGVRRAGRNVRYLRQDLADLDAHAPAVERIVAELGAIDCLVNNAGVTSLVRGDMLELTPESFERSIGINLRGTFFLTQAVARSMLARPSAAGRERYRSLVTITSANADIVGLNRADYCMTKAALSMASKLWAARLAAEGIHVFEIRPGIIETDMTRPASAKYDAFIADGGVPLQRWGKPDDVAAAVATIAGGGLPFATGEIINVGGGLHLHRV